MAKITISRLFEVSQYLTTDAGKDLKDALVYLSEFVEVTVRALRNNLTFEDNFATTIKTVNVISGSETTVLDGTTEKRRVRQVMVRKVVNDSNYCVTCFGWKYNAQGNVVVKIDIENTPTLAIPIEILIIFG